MSQSLHRAKIFESSTSAIISGECVPQVIEARKADVAATRVSDERRAQVTILGPSTLGLQLTASAPATRVTVSPLIVQRIASLEAEVAAKAARIRALEQLVAADSTVILAQAAENALLRSRQAPRCSTKCGVAIGAAAVTILAAVLGGGVP